MRNPVFINGHSEEGAYRLARTHASTFSDFRQRLRLEARALKGPPLLHLIVDRFRFRSRNEAARSQLSRFGCERVMDAERRGKPRRSLVVLKQ